MKLELKQDTFKSNFGLEGIDAKINPDQLKKMWEMFANPYKDNISSIVREITSNCFDSHKEAKVDDAVIITFDKDQGGNFIMFSDFGTGLSPERIEKIYINYLSSTKEASNEFIGAFGIGSKSPLSYTDVFFIDTVYEGIKYSYLMRKGDEAPRIEKITETPVTQRNGTDIKIYIKDQNKPSSDNLNLGDIGSFAVAIKKQLKYFDNVVIRMSSSLHHLGALRSYLENLNNFTIYEGEHFIYRKDNHSVQELSICLGKVDYPIDYKIVFPDLAERINLPVSLKFDIGDLMVTHSREDIKYNQATIDKIRKKVSLVINELFDKLAKNAEKNFPVMEYSDLIEFTENQVLYNYVNKYFSLPLSETDSSNKIEISAFMDRFMKITSFSNVPNYYSTMLSLLLSKLNSYNKREINITFAKGKSYFGDDIKIKLPIFTPFENTSLISSSDHFYDLFTITRIQKKTGARTVKVQKHDSWLCNTYLTTSRKKESLYILDDYSDRLDSTFNLYLEDTYKTSLKNVVYLRPVRKLKVYLKFFNDDSKIIKDKSKWRKNIKLLQKEYEEPFLKNVVKLSDIKSKATKEWLKEYNTRNKITVAPKVKAEKEINLKKFSHPYHLNIDVLYKPSQKDWAYESRSFKTMDDFKANEKDFVYTTLKDADLNNNLFNTLYYSFLFHGNNSQVKNINHILKQKRIVFVSQETLKMIKKEGIGESIQDFVNSNKEDLFTIYFYTKFLSQDKIKNLQNIEKQFIPSLEKEGAALVLYYLMGNDFLSELNDTKIEINEIIRVYNLMNKNIFDQHFKKYSEVIEKLFTGCGLDFEKECKLREDNLLKKISDYSLKLNNHYHYIQFIYAFPYMKENDNGIDKIFLNKFKLIEELGLIKKDSIFGKMKEKTIDKNKAVEEIKKDQKLIDLKLTCPSNLVKFINSSNSLTYEYSQNKPLLNLDWYLNTYQNYINKKQ